MSKLLEKPKVIICLGLETIPEDSEVKDDDFPNLLPEERVEDDPDAEPDSGDEYETQPNMS